ncbi:MAG: YhfC family intramembrane metalloprotease [Anaerolineaceae bacterium]|nr:YhfC family intramembrane metalloprotease [Anaerolineaceae bacterium]
MLEIMFVIAIAIEIIFPLVLAFWAIRKLGSSWIVFAVGALAFVCSQVIHIPIVLGIQPVWSSPEFTSMPLLTRALISGVSLGFLAAICEEPMRWLSFQLLHEKGDKVKTGVVMGIGHGGIESIVLVGFSVLSSFILMISIRDGGMSIPQVTPEMVQEYFATPWHLPLAGAVERLAAISFHIGMSLVVWKSVKHRSWLWFLGAIVAHTLFNTIAVMMSTMGAGVWAIEVVMVLLAALMMIWVIRTAREEMPEDDDNKPLLQESAAV